MCMYDMHIRVWWSVYIYQAQIVQTKMHHQLYQTQMSATGDQKP